ncbi:MAG: citrate transporter [Ruminococcaceae bacterium]|nr:citrate transporter [Oscillospiraceae bacterium]
MVAAKIIAVLIFLVMFGFIIAEKIEKHIITLVSGAAVLLMFLLVMKSPEAVFRTLSFNELTMSEFWFGGGGEDSGINWATIIFIAGMTVMVQGLIHAGCFNWLCLELAKLVKYKTVPLLITFMVMSAVLSMFIDSITVIMFLAVVTVRLAHLLKFDPIPMVLAEIFCANLGGSATMCGDPPNIIIGTAFGYNFNDFIMNTGVISFFCLLLTIPYFYLIMRKNLKESEKNRPADIEYPDPKEAIKNKAGFVVLWVVFLVVTVLLITHAMTHLTVATIGIIAIVITLFGILVTYGVKDTTDLIKKIDYKTLIFFIGLFMVVSGLEETGVLTLLANAIAKLSGDNPILMVAIVLWISAFASAFIDNIPFAATMVPVISSMAGTTGMSLETLSWTLSMGTDIGGSATPIGASANVVGTSIVMKAGHPVTWGRYCKYNAPITVLVVALTMVIIFIKYF